MNADRFKQQFAEADMVVHTVGTLFDTSITKFRQPGESGTYEQMNRDTFLSVLEQIPPSKKVVYISASGHPPFIPRYESTKKEAEEALLASGNEGYILRPGFIYSWEHRWWSLPLKY
jgi:uncharacterized protein YbjT (DUF2867 family)